MEWIWRVKTTAQLPKPYVSLSFYNLFLDIVRGVKKM